MPPLPRFTVPAPLSQEHVTSQFTSGEPELDTWLRKRAYENLLAGASRTYVTCAAGTNDVVAFYALAMGSIVATDVPGSMRRNMPRVIPAVILGRLAVDLGQQGHGLGGKMLKDAVMRSVRAASEVSARLMLVHAISESAESFYRHHGFVALPGHSQTSTLALELVKFARIATEK